MDPGHKARKNPSDNADLGFQAVGPALRIMQLNVEGLSAAKRHIIEYTELHQQMLLFFNTFYLSHHMELFLFDQLHGSQLFLVLCSLSYWPNGG